MIEQVRITFNGQEVPRSPFSVLVDAPQQEIIIDNDAVDSSIDQQPIYENVIRQTETIIYEHETTNLDDHEDHIYYAHVCFVLKSSIRNHNELVVFQQTNIASIQEHQLCRQISTRSISDPTLNKHPYFSPIKPPRTYCHDERDEELVRISI